MSLLSPLKPRFNPFFSLPPFLRLMFSVEAAIMVAAKAASSSEPLYNVKKVQTCTV